MPFSYRDLIFGGKTFCYCLPVRLGVISMSILGMVAAGLLSIVLWFEVASTDTLTAGERAAFAIGGILETILFAASILGFVGAVVRKQTFLQTYAFILYVHFVFNLAGAIYILHSIISFQQNITEKACEATISDPDAKAQCSGLLRITAAIAVVVAVLVLLIELYGAIIATRYLNLVKHDKQTARAWRENVDEAFAMKASQRFTYTRLGSEHYGQGEYNPYDEVQQPSYHTRGNSDIERQPNTPVVPYIPPVRVVSDGYSDATAIPTSPYDPYANSARLAPSSTSPTSLERQPSAVVDPTRPPVPIEAGYGGGSWTHSEIEDEEKSRLQRSMGGPSETRFVEQLSEEEQTRRRQEQKSIHGPPPSSGDAEVEPLPQYVAYSPPSHGINESLR